MGGVVNCFWTRGEKKRESGFLSSTFTIMPKRSRESDSEEEEDQDFNVRIVMYYSCTLIFP
jgi:hypothetical protein